MGKIQVLDQITIDKIAAGEVIERPASIVKELIENAIDAGATAIVAEIKEGGISFIRITDNGCGIAGDEVGEAFLRHSTSKIRSAEDLEHIASLGFRGEALSSIAAVSQVELITKTRDCDFGTSYRIEGGREISKDETGAPDGTTFLVRQLFYNTPARRKFLKTPMTEASHVGELVTRLALSHPEISFQFINNGQSKIHTSGNGNLKDVIYHIYGRDIAAHLLEVNYEQNGLRITGFIGEPLVSRGNRNFENYFINGRYVKSSMVSKAIEDAYKDFTMQHKYPFTVLHIQVEGEDVDVNVHPTKMEVRFHNQQEIYNRVCEAVGRALRREELIPHVELPEPPKAEGVSYHSTVKTEAKMPEKSEKKANKAEHTLQKEEHTLKLENKKQSSLCKNESALCKNAPEISENHPSSELEMKSKSTPPALGQRDLDYFMKKMRERVMSYHNQNSAAEVKDATAVFKPEIQKDRIQEAVNYRKKEETKQLNFFDENLLKRETVAEYKLIGQVFDTYWLVEFGDNLYIIDQHAAHERVLYEKTLKGMKTRDFTSQNISPPIILNLTMKESELLNTYMDQFTRIGFEIEEFGQESYAVRAVPDNLFSIAKKDLLMEMIDSLSDEIYTGLAPDIIDEKVASMSCKAAVKGNMRLSTAEVETLIGELLKLDNPYHCPHGRPTIIAMTKRELEKKFKRIL
ncbi:DNA mismatch repair endonuclease MutL [Sporofaciens sp. SGI.106]|uniref:DNA mismatch repair endonuclease MutL n=1 Tax=Sporofaciens sp. SGI.106 TaxID=3420568 RepID=UPI003D076A39